MLITMQEAAKDECEVFPSPERIDKVEESMKNLEDVVRERNKAYWELEVGEGETGERKRVFRRDIFGRWRWYSLIIYLIISDAKDKTRSHLSLSSKPSLSA